MLDGLIYNVGEWVGLRSSTFREHSAWWTDRRSQVVHSVDRFVVQPALARELFCFAFRFCRMDSGGGDLGTLTSLIGPLQNLVVRSFAILVAKWLFLVAFNAMVSYGLLEPFFPAQLTHVVHSGGLDSASAENSHAPDDDRHGSDPPAAERISKSPDRDSESEPPNPNEEEKPRAVGDADSEAHAAESDRSSS